MDVDGIHPLPRHLEPSNTVLKTPCLQASGQVARSLVMDESVGKHSWPYEGPVCKCWPGQFFICHWIYLPCWGPFSDHALRRSPRHFLFVPSFAHSSELSAGGMESNASLGDWRRCPCIYRKCNYILKATSSAHLGQILFSNGYPLEAVEMTNNTKVTND